MAYPLSIDDILAANNLPTNASAPTVAPIAQSPAPSGMMFSGIAPSTPASMPVTPVSATPNVPTPSFFGQGGTGRNLAGIIGDALLSGTGRQAVYAPLQAKKQEMQWQAKQDAYKQQLEGVRQQQLAAFKAANPEPTEFQRDYAYFNQLDPTGGLAGKFAAQKADGAPILGTVNGVTGLISRSSFGGAGQPGASAQPSAPNAAAIAYLKANPSAKGDFDAKYGAGLADAILGTGGASPSGSPTFR